MKCPTCSTDLKQIDFLDRGFITLDTCQTCNGTWFDKGELDSFDESVWTDVEAIDFSPTSGDARNCPKCGTGMDPISPPDTPDLVIDRCVPCGGFWLDDGELEKMRDVAADIDAERLKNIRHYTKPGHMSRLSWIIYCFKTFK